MQNNIHKRLSFFEINASELAALNCLYSEKKTRLGRQCANKQL